MKRTFFFLCLILLISCKTNSDRNNLKTDIKMENLNKQLILDVYSKVFGQGDLSLADSIFAESYIQHSPTVKTGKSGLMEFLNMLKQMPKPDTPQNPFMRLICDSNFVAVHLQIEFMGKENAVVDLYRIENGQLVEHWDAVQEIVDSMPVVVGSVEIEADTNTNENKQIIETFVKQVLVKKQFNKTAHFIANNVTAEGFDTNYESFKLHRIIGEANFVLTQSEIVINEVSFVLYDIYRLSNRLIVEHWSVKQIIPDEMAHSNGMI